jgi:putative tryptophan/tyrosine transport system substrate-binding protein
MRRRDFIAALGGAAASPLVARAQAKKSYRLGYLALLPSEDTTLAKPLLQRLQELGYRDGVNMILDYRSAGGRAERLPQLAAELVRASPDLLIAGFGTLAPKAAIAATSSIPDCLHVSRRPGWGRPDREFESAGRKCHGPKRAGKRHHRQAVAAP